MQANDETVDQAQRIPIETRKVGGFVATLLDSGYRAKGIPSADAEALIC